MNLDDRRVRRTKKAIKESLAELMLEKDLRYITVRALTDQADIHRATFYSHYMDVYDLYEQMQNEVTNELTVVIDSTYTYDQIINSIVEYVYNNAKMCRLFLDRNSNRSFYDRISNLLEEKYAEIWLFETGAEALTEEQKYCLNYHMQGCLSIISRWAKDNFSYPKEEIIRIIQKLEETFDGNQ